MAIEQPEYAVERYLRGLGGGRPEPSTLGFYAAIDAVRAADPFVAKHVVQELADQRSNVKLIASENYSSLAVQQAMGNLLTDKYAEGYPWHRFYAGCDNVDAIEEHGAKLARDLFGASHAYLQPHSGADANLVAFLAILATRVENRVLDRLAVPQTRRSSARRRLRWLALAVALPAVAAAAAWAMSVSYSSDRRLASQYRAALDGAHGKYFQSARLASPTGQVAGIVFAYQGSPSWLFYTLGGSYGGGLYTEQIVTRSGRTLTLPPFRLVNGSWGIATPVPVRDIALVKLIHQPRGPALTTNLPIAEQ